MKELREFIRSLGGKVLLVTFISIILIAGFFGVISYYNSYNALHEVIIQSMTNRAKDNTLLVSRELAKYKTIVAGIADDPRVRTMD